MLAVWPLGENQGSIDGKSEAPRQDAAFLLAVP